MKLGYERMGSQMAEELVDDEPLDLFRNFTPEEIEAMKIKGPAYGHTWHLSEETKAKMSQPKSESHKKKIKFALIGRVAGPEPNKLGWATRRERYPDWTFSEEAIKKISMALLGRSCKPMSEEAKKYLSEINTDKYPSDESRVKMAISNLGKTSGRPMLESTKKALLEANVGKHPSESTLKKLSEAATGRKHSKESIEQMSKSREEWWANASKQDLEKWFTSWSKGHRSKLNWDEVFLGIYLESRFPGEWAFNSNYQQGITIGRKVPDFVNVNGKKAVVEMFGHYRHPDWHEKVWIEHYAKYGYKCTVVWEEEVYSEGRLNELFGVKI